jgi:hypothetical protein
MATQPPNANPPAPWRASVAARWLAAAAAGGSALQIASYFMVWQRWAIPASEMASGKAPPPVIPVENIGLFQGLHGGSTLPYALWMFAPPVITALGALIALVAPRWSRLTLTLLSALAAGYSLSQSLGAFSSRLFPNPYIADVGAYVGVSANLLSFSGASGLLVIALTGTWRALKTDASRARNMTRRWAWLVISGGALLIASYFMPWRHFYLGPGLSDADPASSNSAPWPLNPAPESPHIPLDLSGLASISEPYRTQNLIMVCLIFLVPPTLAALSAYFALSGPRWNQVTWSLWSALMGAIVLIVSLGFLALSAFTDSAASSVIDLGGYIGVGASILILVAAVGLLFSTLNGAWSARSPRPQS